MRRVLTLVLVAICLACPAPGRASSVSIAPSAAPGAVVDAHRILAGNWFSEREPDFDLHVEATAVVFSASDPQWLAWDLTSVVRRWQRALVPNNGLLLKLQDGDEDFGVGGPYGPSAGSLDAGLRPRLVVTYSGPGPR